MKIIINFEVYKIKIHIKLDFIITFSNLNFELALINAFSNDLTHIIRIEKNAPISKEQSKTSTHTKAHMNVIFYILFLFVPASLQDILIKWRTLPLEREIEEEQSGMPMMRAQRFAGSVLVLDARRVYGSARALRVYELCTDCFRSVVSLKRVRTTCHDSVRT